MRGIYEGLSRCSKINTYEAMLIDFVADIKQQMFPQL